MPFKAILETLSRLTGMSCFYHVLESKYHVKTKCVAIDFSAGMEIYDKIAAQLAGLEIGVLGELYVF
jgi:hypothetical protein